MTIKLLELYSGIGGIHFALKNLKNIKFEVLAAFDINQLCNLVYMHNFKNTKVFSKCLTSLSAEDIDSFDVDLITMSPPCQPFTLVGKQMDVNDMRLDSLKHILNILPILKNKPVFIFVENVAAFEKSQMRDQLISILYNLNYAYQEFLLNPLQFGIPNSRLRYYLIAKLQPNNSFSLDNYQILKDIPVNLYSWTSSLYMDNTMNNNSKINDTHVKNIIYSRNSTNSCLLENYLEDSIDFSPYFISDKLLLKFWIMDIVNSKKKKVPTATLR